VDNDKQGLPVRIIAAGLPLLVIALVFGAVGYATTEPERTPLPALAAADPGVPAVQGEITSISGGQVTLVTESGESLSYTLPAAASVELLVPIDVAVLRIGDWLNGGGIPHPDTVLALVSLILLPEPVTP
jgi:hypothetical protein